MGGRAPLTLGPPPCLSCLQAHISHRHRKYNPFTLGRTPLSSKGPKLEITHDPGGRHIEANISPPPMGGRGSKSRTAGAEMGTRGRSLLSIFGVTNLVMGNWFNTATTGTAWTLLVWYPHSIARKLASARRLVKLAKLNVTNLPPDLQTRYRTVIRDNYNHNY